MLAEGTIENGVWEVDFNTAEVANGPYNITINATDFAGLQKVLNLSEVDVSNIIDEIAPNISIVRPLQGSNVSQSLYVRASINDTIGIVSLANMTLYNATSNATAWQTMTLESGTTTAGFWSVTFDTSGVLEGAHNISVNSTDNSGNANTSKNVSVTIDRSLANISRIIPENATLYRNSQILINSTVNDSLTGIFNVSYRFIGRSHQSTWLAAQMQQGTILSGNWNHSLHSSQLPDADYNITINATDFAGNQNVINV